MSYIVAYNPITKIIETNVEGEVTLEVLKFLFTEQAQLSAQENCHLFLNDYRKAKLRLSTLDIYELPGIIAEIAAKFGSDARATIRALVVEQDSDDYYFYETVAANNLQTEKVFFDLDQAKQWLCGTHG